MGPPHPAGRGWCGQGRLPRLAALSWLLVAALLLSLMQISRCVKLDVDFGESARTQKSETGILLRGGKGLPRSLLQEPFAEAEASPSPPPVAASSSSPTPSPVMNGTYQDGPVQLLAVLQLYGAQVLPFGDEDRTTFLAELNRSLAVGLYSRIDILSIEEFLPANPPLPAPAGRRLLASPSPSPSPAPPRPALFENQPHVTITLKFLTTLLKAQDLELQLLQDVDRGLLSGLRARNMGVDSIKLQSFVLAEDSPNGSAVRLVSPSPQPPSPSPDGGDGLNGTDIGLILGLSIPFILAGMFAVAYLVRVHQKRVTLQQQSFAAGGNMGADKFGQAPGSAPAGSGGGSGFGSGPPSQSWYGALPGKAVEVGSREKHATQSEGAQTHSGDRSEEARAFMEAMRMRDSELAGAAQRDGWQADSGGSMDTPTREQRRLRNHGPMLDTSSWTIRFSELAFSRSIGEGSFGRVYLGKWRETTVAIKLLTKLQLDPSAVLASGDVGESDDALHHQPATGSGTPTADPKNLLDELRKEAGIMAGLRHPNVVMFLGVCPDPPCMVTEFCARGSLLDVLRRGHASPAAGALLDWPRRLSMALDAAKGMLYLHSRAPAILHRDLKSANLLVDRHWRVKVADFNLSRVMVASNVVSSVAATNPRWLAPEVLAGRGYNCAADVYSFGIILWELLTWRIPWGDAGPWQVVIEVVDKGLRPEIPAEGLLPGLPLHGDGAAQYMRLMQQCWCSEPDERPTFEAIIASIRSILETESSLGEPSAAAPAAGLDMGMFLAAAPTASNSANSQRALLSSDAATSEAPMPTAASAAAMSSASPFAASHPTPAAIAQPASVSVSPFSGGLPLSAAAVPNGGVQAAVERAQLNPAASDSAPVSRADSDEPPRPLATAPQGLQLQQQVSADLRASPFARLQRKTPIGRLLAAGAPDVPVATLLNRA